jgi:hypothetical protein
MKLKAIVAASAVIAAVHASTGASASPVQFGSTGLYFDFVRNNGISWTDAAAAAGSSIFDGVNGYLAVITSSAENSFVYSIAPSFPIFDGAWLGGEVNALGQGIWEVGPLAGTQFSIGQAPFGGAYANWGGIEPNDAPSAAYMNIGRASGINPGQWADAANGIAFANGDPIRGYFVEYAVTPLPGTWIMMLGGFSVFGAAAYRRRKRIAILTV